MHLIPRLLKGSSLWKRQLIFEGLLREGCRRKVSKTRLFPLRVIRNFDIVDDCLTCLFMRNQAAVMGKFIVKGAQNFPSGAVITIRFTTHGGVHAKLFDHRLIVVRAVPTAPIGYRISPGLGRYSAIAPNSACITSVLVMRSPMA